MPEPRAFEFKAWVNTPFTLLARVYDESRTLINQSSVSTITYKVMDGTGNVDATGSQTVGSVVFNSLQNDSRWSVDSVGYNFAPVIPSTAITETGYYQIEMWITMTSGTSFPVVWRGVCMSLQSH